MNILVDARPLAIARPGGVTKVVAQLLTPLLEELREHHVVLGTTGWHKPDLSSYLAPHVEHRHIRAPNKLFTALTSFGLSSFDQFFHSSKPDLLLLFNLGHIGQPRIPYHLVVHDLALFIEPSWFSLRSQGWRYAVHGASLTKNARHLFAVSASTKQSLIDQFKISPERISLLSLGRPSLVPAEPLPSELTSKKYLLILGGNDRRKNVGCVIEAFDRLKKNPIYDDLYLVIVGKPVGTISKGTLILDRPSDGTLRSLFEHCTAFLYPSWYEGFGLPLHEAAAFHRPCVASTAGALPETAPQGTLFAPPAKPQFWLHDIQMILQNPSAYPTVSSLSPGAWKDSASHIASFCHL